MRWRLRRPFYGWWIVGAGVGISGLTSALMYQAFGTYIVLLEREFGWGRTMLAGAFSIARIEDGIVAPVQGWVIDRVGPRAVMRAGVIVLGAGFLLFSRVDSVVGFYAAVLVMAFGAELSGFLSITTAIVNWFERRRSFAMGIGLLGAAVGGFAVPLVVLALETFGWRAVAAGSGVLVLVVGLPLVQVVRGRPELYGEVPDGGPPRDWREPAADQPAAEPPGPQFSARQAMATRAFWFISLAHAAAVLVVSVVQVHFVAHVEAIGLSLTGAAGFLTLMTAMNLIGRVAGGWLGDFWSSRAVIVACLLAHAASLLFLTFATSLWMVGAFAVLNGLAWGARVPVIVALRAEYFGARSYGTIMGFSSLVVTIGSVSGPVLAGLSYDLTGSYASGFTALAVLAALGSIFVLLLRRPAAPAAAAPTTGGAAP